MDRPRTPLGWVIRIALILACAGVVIVLLTSAAGFVGNFISPDSGDGPGNAGQLLMALLIFVFAAPFIALILAMGLPIVSDNPKWRGADR